MEGAKQSCINYAIMIFLLVSIPGSSFAMADTQQAPNILLIVADDLGYSDIGAYGGEINTPHLDTLAQRGIRFSDFSVAPTCSTTRSMLLTGVDNHLNGLGGLDSTGRPRKESMPGYEGQLNSNVVTVASLLQDHGYHTYMSGKWHLGYSLEAGPEKRGFDSVFVLPGGAATHFSDRGLFGNTPLKYRENGKIVSIPEDFYSSNYFTDKMIEYLEENKDDSKPFFAYLSFTAPHWPLQAPEALIKKYEGVYDAGYDAIRKQRLENLESIGMLKVGSAAPQINPMQQSWESLDEETQARETRHMQIYAAMVDSMDQNIGRLLDYLDNAGEKDNTVIIFISDNGPEGNDPYVITKQEAWLRENFKTDTSSLGSPGSFSSYGPGWAGVSATPFSLYKAFTAEGGIRVPAIFVLPALEDRASTIVHDFASVLDITPTILELAGLEPVLVGKKNSDRLSIQGKSLVDYLTGHDREIRQDNEAVGWELLGRKALRSGKWKISWIEQPYGKGDWALYNLASDPAEILDLSQKESAQMQIMLRYWENYVNRNRVVEYEYSDLRYSGQNKHYQR